MAFRSHWRLFKEIEICFPPKDEKKTFTQLAFTCSMLITEMPEQCVKFDQSLQ